MKDIKIKIKKEELKGILDVLYENNRVSNILVVSERNDLFVKYLYDITWAHTNALPITNLRGD